MGREINRVPLDFDFPIGASYADAQYDKAMESHKQTCNADNHDECEVGDYSVSPPDGDGWQLWQTVSDGPVSPVFATSAELVDWMCLPEPDPSKRHRLAGPWAQGWRRESADALVRMGNIPSMVAVGGRALAPEQIEAMRTKAEG